MQSNTWSLKSVWYAYLGFAESSHTQEALVIVDGHNTGNNGAFYPNLTTIVDKFEEDISVIEELSNNEVCSGINLIE